ncbi:MAG: EI24 domain-containing protein [Bacteriovoracaceae bacterium]
MNKIIKTFGISLNLLRKDRIVMLYGLIPLVIGLVLFYFLGNYLYTDLLEIGKSYIEQNIQSSGWASAFYYFIFGILTVLFFFMINWGFVLIVSFIASPFNDLLSSRVEKIISEKELTGLGKDFERIIGRFFFTIINEFKKISFIVLLTLMSFLLGIVPLVGPVLSTVIASALIAIQFLDYSWSRHDLSLKQCVSDLKSTPFIYMVSGFLFVFLLSIPIVNIFCLPLAVVYFTVHFSQKNMKRS